MEVAAALDFDVCRLSIFHRPEISRCAAAPIESGWFSTARFTTMPNCAQAFNSVAINILRRQIPKQFFIFTKNVGWISLTRSKVISQLLFGTRIGNDLCWRAIAPV